MNLEEYVWLWIIISIVGVMFIGTITGTHEGALIGALMGQTAALIIYIYKE